MRKKIEPIRQHLAILDEAETSIKLIRAGLGLLQGIDGSNDFYHLPLLTLSSGFERLMKVTWCLRHIEVHGSYPSKKDLLAGRNGHDLISLRDRIVTDCFLPEYTSQAAVEDKAYLAGDEAGQILGILKNFAQGGRYYNLEVITGKISDDYASRCPAEQWKALEKEAIGFPESVAEMLQRDPVGATHHIRNTINSSMVARIERMARAICRLYTMGNIGRQAHQYYGYLSHFIQIRDCKLGTHDYR